MVFECCFRERRNIAIPPHMGPALPRQEDDGIYQDAEPDTESNDDIEVPLGMYLDLEPISDESDD